ncbi:MAG: tRNA adenosine(34) deaminase TadA [Pseudomonadales bacterium]|nr:tRNA adenosine(34) deaminase TadA [Pseudomonadales bacterium]
MPTISDDFWMARALALAAEAAASEEVPIGAVVVRDGEVIGEGFNQTLTLRDPTAHAEIIALRRAAEKAGNHRLVNCELFVTVEPCTMCAGALVHARIARLVYGAAEPRAGAVASSARVLDNPGLNHKVKITSGVCADQAGRLMSDFFKQRR